MCIIKSLAYHKFYEVHTCHRMPHQVSRKFCEFAPEATPGTLYLAMTATAATTRAKRKRKPERSPPPPVPDASASRLLDDKAAAKMLSTKMSN